MFEKLGYIQTEINELNNIQYTKRAKESEMKRIGMIQTTWIEIYTSTKEILVYTEYEHRSGKKSKSDIGILNFEEFKAIQKQILELNWGN